MKMPRLVWAAVTALTLGNVCLALDTVKTAKSTVSGRVTGIDHVKVVVEHGVGGAAAAEPAREIPVNQVQTIFFDGEPAELKSAKTHVLGGRYAEALAALQRIKNQSDRAEVEQDIEFYKALCAAKIALAENGKLSDAGRMMKAFADRNTKSYHYFEASELLGDLLAAVGQYAPAAEYYGRLDAAPWPDLKMRADVAIGRALLAQGKVAEAQKTFDLVVATEAEGSLAQRQRVLAKLGKASVLLADKKPDEAMGMVDDILKTADPEDAPLLARAYNVLGTAHRQAGRPTEALLAFLHVDLLYPAPSDAHAEALANMVELWKQVRQVQRAEQARKTLNEKYPDSPWAKKGGGGA